MAEAVDEEIKFKIGAEGNEQVARLLAELNRTLGGTSAALDSASVSASRVNRALPMVAQSSERASRSISDLQRTTQKGAVVIGQLTSAVGAISPELGAMTSGIGRAGAALGALSTVAGGPVVIGIGLAVGAFTALSKLLSETDDKTQALTESTQILGTTIEEEIDKLSRLDRASSLRSRVELGAGGEAEQFAEIRRLEGRRDQLLGQRAAGVGGERGLALGRELQGVTAALERARAARAQILAEDALGVAEGETEANVGADLKDIGGKRARRKEEAFKAAFAQADKDNTQRERFLFRDKGMDDFQAQSLKAAKEINQGWKDSVSDRMEAESRAHEERMRLLEEEQERTRELQGAGIEAFTAVGASGVRALAAVAKGQKVTGRQILAGIGDEMVGLGTKWFFEGLARTFLGDPSGGALMGVGTAEIAAGIALGAASAKGGGGRGGGGSGSGGRAMSPTASPDRSLGTPSDQPLIVNFHSTFPPSAQDGERVVQAMKEAQRQGRLQESFA